MKDLIITLTIALFAFETSAQQIIFKEDFDSYPGLAINNWNTNERSAPVGWQTSDMYNLYCSYSKIPSEWFWARVAAISGCYGDKGGPRNNVDILMYSKPIDLSTTTKGAVLRFDSYFNGNIVNGKQERATVEVSINNGTTWTVVKNVDKVNSTDSFIVQYADLSAYLGNNNVLLGFRYSDVGEDHKLGGWAIDNIEVFEPRQRDLSLTVFHPENKLENYFTLNTDFIHTGTALNLGLDTIKNFTVNYQNNGGAIYTDTVDSVVIAPYQEFNFTHAIPNQLTSAGANNITAWVSVGGDEDLKNDTLERIVYGAHFMPKKLVTIEEGTGTWMAYAPRGFVYFETVHRDDEAALVSIHSTDPMEQEALSDYLYDLNYYQAPFFLFDRSRKSDNDNFFETLQEYKRHFGFADLDLYGQVFGNDVWLEVTVKPALDLKGDFKVAMILTEDNVSGTDSAWTQKNAFYTGSLGPMGGYENKPEFIDGKDINYDFVARGVYPSADGAVLGTVLQYGSEYKHKFHAVIDPEWNKNNMRAIVMLIDGEDSTILNSNKLNYFLSVAGNTIEEQTIGLYPNPANGHTTLEYRNIDAGEEVNIGVMDISGRVVNNISETSAGRGRNRVAIPTANLIAGMYIINVQTGGSKQVLKLQVMH